jgi:hypothetical protein
MGEGEGKKRWRKEEKWREKEEEISPPSIMFCIRHCSHDISCKYY